MKAPSPEILTVKEAAELLRTTPAAIYAAVERGQLPGIVRLGRRLLFRAADLRRHLGLLDPEAPNSPHPEKAA